MSRLHLHFKVCEQIFALCVVTLSLCASVVGSVWNVAGCANPVYRRGESMMERVLPAFV